MQLTTRLRPRVLGWLGIALAVALPPALGASYVGAVNATSFEERNFLWMVTLALTAAAPLAPLLIVFGTEAVTRPDPEALARIDKIISELEYANRQAEGLDSGLVTVRAVADHMSRRIEEAHSAPAPAPGWRR